MPVIDEESGALVIRIVYDGPPFSGKTTSLKALSHGLGVKMTTPAEVEGRTAYFDWVEYSGGLFEGRRIRCQMIGVPGQAHLAHRRAALLEEADAVVVVANTRAPEIEGAGHLVAEVLDWAAQITPPVGVVIQANQRDAADALPKDALRRILCGTAPVAIVETVAVEGDGVREAFVFGVRLALDRARECLRRGELGVGRQSHSTPDLMLSHLEAVESRVAIVMNAPSVRLSEQDEAPEVGTPSNVATDDAPSSHPRAEAKGAPDSKMQSTRPAQPIQAVGTAGATPEAAFVPDPMMPAGFIWPPVRGRALLHEVADLALQLTRTPRGDLSALGQGWWIHSTIGCSFDSTDEARPALIDWARVHAAAQRTLSSGRAVILSPWDGTQRLWQLVQIHPSLRESLLSAVERMPAGALAETLMDASTHLARARRVLRDANLTVKCSLWTIGDTMSRPPEYVGLMPGPHDVAHDELDGHGLIEREFAPVLENIWTERDDAQSVMHHLVERAQITRDEAQRSMGQIASARMSVQ